MGSPVPNEDFVMILITSLPEAWDDYTLAYLGSSRNKLELGSRVGITSKGQKQTWKGEG